MRTHRSDATIESASSTAARDESASAHSSAETHSRIPALLYFVFFLSGFSALVYQTAWQRMLGLFGGSDAIAATLVVGAFLFGLGIGSLWAAAFADRLSGRRAIQAFALCELGIATFALTSRLLFYNVLFGELVALARSPTLILAVVFLALLLPTVLMGMSLPLLSKAIVVRIETASSEIGWLYGVNTLGAGIGALLAGFYIIGTLGYEVAVYFGALLNLLVGAGALLVASGLRGETARAPERVVPLALRRIPSRVWSWSLLVFVSGFLIISLEIVWFRVLGLLMQTNAYAFSLVLGVFLVGDALGIVYGARVVRGIADPRRFFQWLQGAVALDALVSLGLIYLAHGWLDLPPWFVDASHYGTYRSGSRLLIRFLVNSSLTVFVVLPPAFLLGMSFPITQKAVQDDPALIGQRVGLIQLFNILGNTAGAVVTGLVLLHCLGTAGTLRLIGMVGLLFVVALFCERPREPEQSALPTWATQGRVHATFAALLAVMLVLFPANAAFWMQLHGTAPGAGALVGEDRTGVAVLRPKQDRHSLYIGGHTQSQVPFSRAHGALGVVGALVHPDPRSILVIGHGTGGTPYASGVNPTTERIRVVEIVAPVFSVMRQFAHESGGTVVDEIFRDPRFELSVADARHVLFTDPRRYDVIQADAIYPWSSQSGLLYSVEFFRKVRERLREGGICVQWAPTDRTLASFLSVFPHVVRVNDALLGSDRPIPFALDAVAERLRGPARPYLVAGGWDPEALLAWLSERPLEVWEPTDPRGHPDVNTDLFPKDEYFLNKRKIILFGNTPGR
jgi:spermidine synthase